MVNKVSVIVPVYNVEKYLRQCLDSLTQQTYRNLEIIIVNDGSTDKSGAICEEYALKDSRIHLISQANAGQSAARNAGLSMASGDYITFVDSDDWVEPDFIQSLYAMMIDNKADIVCCDYLLEYENKSVCAKIGNKGDKEEYSNSFLLASKLPVTVWYKLYKKKLLINQKFVEGIKCEDVPFTMQVFSRMPKTRILSEPKYHYRQRSSSTVNSLKGIKKDAEKYVWELHDELLEYNSQIIFSIWYIKLYCADKDKEIRNNCKTVRKDLLRCLFRLRFKGLKMKDLILSLILVICPGLYSQAFTWKHHNTKGESLKLFA